MQAEVERFAEITAVPGVDLGAAALAIAAGADPLVDPGVWLEELDRLATGVEGTDGLVDRLFVEHGFAGTCATTAIPRTPCCTGCSRAGSASRSALRW